MDPPLGEPVLVAGVVGDAAEIEMEGPPWPGGGEDYRVVLVGEDPVGGPPQELPPLHLPRVGRGAQACRRLPGGAGTVPVARLQEDRRKGDQEGAEKEDDPVLSLEKPEGKVGDREHEGDGQQDRAGDQEGAAGAAARASGVGHRAQPPDLLLGRPIRAEDRRGGWGLLAHGGV